MRGRTPTVLLKLGGAVAPELADHVCHIAAGARVCVVHGAGPQISARMAAVGIAVEFVGGRRVTSAAAIAHVRAALLEVNAVLCGAIGARAVGLAGDEIGMRARHAPELGCVGEPVVQALPVLSQLMDAGMIPVVAPMAVGPLNVNADDAAAALAVSLGADELRFVSDVSGLLDAAGAVVERIDADGVDRLLGAGVLDGGIVPKLAAAAQAARARVRVRIGETEVTT